MKTAVVCGAGGFIGGHLVSRLKQDGYWVRAIDRKQHEFKTVDADEFILGDLRDASFCSGAIDIAFDEVYQLAAEMGGAEFVYDGRHDATILRDSTIIDLHVLSNCLKHRTQRIFFASSACVYPRRNQLDPNNPICGEDSVYPADPDSEYGWTKLFGERLYLAHERAGVLQPRIARYHNVFGPQGAWRGGREKAPAALCRKVAEAPDEGSIDILGDGQQTRSFLFISECIEGTVRLMRSDVPGPLNIGSDEMVTIDHLADLIIDISGKTLRKNYILGRSGCGGEIPTIDVYARRLVGLHPNRSVEAWNKPMPGSKCRSRPNDNDPFQNCPAAGPKCRRRR
jgi:GDP-D-mannose 3', 5'-epimerase